VRSWTNAYHLLFICQCVLHYEPRILQALFGLCHFVPMDDLVHFFHILMDLLDDGPSECQNPQPKCGHFEACMLFRGLCSTHGVITKGFLSILWVSEATFSRWQQNLMQVLCSLSSAISQDYKNRRMHLTQTHLNVNCTKTQCSVTVTLIKLIHNKSPLQYLALQSCVISCLCSIWWVQKHLAYTSYILTQCILNVISLIPC